MLEVDMFKLSVLAFLLEILIVSSQDDNVEFKTYCPDSAKCLKDAVCPEGSFMKECEKGCCCESDPQECGDNEEWTNCNKLNNCNNCSDLFGGPACKPSDVCEPGCKCLDGYRRDEAGDCVPEDDCQAVCPENEVYSECLGGCGGNCIYPHIQNKQCTPDCQKGCTCDVGHVRAQNGTCILSTECEYNCGVNEEWKRCNDRDKCLDCDYEFFRRPCESNPRSCNPGCGCIVNHSRFGPNGKCIPTSQCKPFCKVNEVETKCRDCHATCDQPDLSKVKCGPSCNRGCTCAKGYVKGRRGTCIPFTDCGKQCKDDNETWSTCANNECNSCDVLMSGAQCRPGPCKEGCTCKKGFYRSKTGACFTADECNIDKCIFKKNEYWTKCKGGCDLTCKNQDRSKLVCPRECREGCLCHEEFVRDENGVCIKPHQCPRPCGVNEAWSACGRYTCDRCGLKYSDEKCTKACDVGCGCLPGYWRSAIGRGECILEKDCKPDCKPDEVYSNCKALCDNTCADPKAKEKCKGCVKGCACPEGTVRNNQWNCVPLNQCPKK